MADYDAYGMAPPVTGEIPPRPASPGRSEEVGPCCMSVYMWTPKTKSHRATSQRDGQGGRWGVRLSLCVVVVCVGVFVVVSGRSAGLKE
jgi:hypothetical protein